MAKTKKNGKSAKKVVAKKRAPTKKPVKKVEAVPARYGTATPHIIVSPCGQALEFYKKAFGAKVLEPLVGPGGVIMHAEMKIGDSFIMLADEMPPMPGIEAMPRKAPRSAGATTGGVMLYVKNADSTYAAAVAAGGKGVLPPADTFWGDRYCQVQDPFGHVWAIATHTRDVSMAEMKKAMANMAPPSA
jgi:uncharacterized glyoxalase superfamily protein PhnB